MNLTLFYTYSHKAAAAINTEEKKVCLGHEEQKCFRKVFLGHQEVDDLELERGPQEFQSYRYHGQSFGNEISPGFICCLCFYKRTHIA